MNEKELCYFLGIVSGMARTEIKYGSSMGWTNAACNIREELEYLLNECIGGLHYDFVSSITEEFLASEKGIDNYIRLDSEIFDFISNL